MAKQRNPAKSTSATAQPRRDDPAQRSPARPADADFVAQRFRSFAAAGLLLLLAVLTYLPVYRADLIAFDDYLYVRDNAALRSADGLRRIWLEPTVSPQYYPLTFTSLWVEHQLFGDHPYGYHIDNVLLHGACGILAWLLMARLKVPGAWVAAAIFVVHPVAVESVAWVTERKNVLSLALALGAMVCYLRFAPPEDGEASARDAGQASTRRWLYYALAFVLFAGALFSKTAVVALPAVLLVVVWWKRGHIRAADVWPLLPLFALGGALGGFTAWLERSNVGAQGTEFTFSLIERTLIAGHALWFYAGKILWPHPVLFFYTRWQINAADWRQYLYPASALAVMVGLWLARGRIGRGPLAAVLIFAGVLVPALGFFNIHFWIFSFVADHFQYHALLPLIALVVATATIALGRVTESHRAIVGGATGAAVVAILAVLSFREAVTYHDTETLYRALLEKSPENWIACNNLAIHLDDLGRRDEALETFHQALEIEPNDPKVHQYLAMALLKPAAGAAADPRDVALGIDELRTALRIKPDYVEANLNLGFELARRNQAGEAVPHFEAVLKQSPLDVRAAHRAAAQFGLGQVLARQGQDAASIERFDQAIALDPELSEAWLALAEARMRTAEFQLAVACYEQAVALRPDDAVAVNNLGIALMNLGKVDAAIERFRQAVRMQPDYEAAKANLERAMRDTGAAGKPE